MRRVSHTQRGFAGPVPELARRTFLTATKHDAGPVNFCLDDRDGEFGSS